MVEERTEPLRVIVADDDSFARRMIKDALNKAGIQVIAEAGNGRDAVELTLFYRPDVVLMDVVMPALDGIGATRMILSKRPEQIVVLLTSAPEDEMGLLGLRAGAAGFLTKDVDVAELPNALLDAIKGDAVMSGHLGRRLVETLRESATGAPGLRPVKSPLTAREWEVIDLLFGGETTEQMAQSLVLSTETVRSHIKNIMRKLGVNTRADAVAIAQKMRGAPPS
jgi:DNA-binding NarL/FixJ family response regulator